MTKEEVQDLLRYIGIAEKSDNEMFEKHKIEAVEDKDMTLYLRGYIEGYKKAMQLCKAIIQCQADDCEEYNSNNIK